MTHKPTHTTLRGSTLLLLSCLLICGGLNAHAEDDVEGHKLTRCLARAEASPDITLVEADAWLKQGGGDRAKLCRAFAQFHSSQFSSAAQEFSALAVARDIKDPRRAAALHNQAALAYMRLGNHRKAEEQYAASLKLEPQDADVLVDRATERAAAERYWDAIDDLNAALTIMPDTPEALLLRGQSWAKLGHMSKAQSDFERAAIIEEAGKPTP